MASRNKELCGLVIAQLHKKLPIDESSIPSVEKLIMWMLKEKDCDRQRKKYQEKRSILGNKTRECKFCKEPTTNWFAACCDKPACREKLELERGAR